MKIKKCERVDKLVNVCDSVDRIWLFLNIYYYLCEKITKRAMNIYIISYDLRKPSQNYTSLYEAIKAYGDWQHPMESLWAIYTDEDANEICNKLRPKIDVNDSILVVRLSMDTYQGWLPKSFWEWVNSKRNQ